MAQENVNHESKSSKKAKICALCERLPPNKHGMCPACGKKVELRAQESACDRMSHDGNEAAVLLSFLMENCNYHPQLTAMQGMQLEERIYPFWV